MKPLRLLASFAFKLFLLVIVMAGLCTAQGEVSVSPKVDHSEITLGDIITYTIELRHPQGYKLVPPPLGAQFGEFFIRDFHQPNPRTENGVVVDSMQYKITTYITGKVKIPAMTFHWESPSGQKGDVTVPEMEINVKSIAGKDAMDIRGLKEPVEIPVKMWPYYAMGIGAVVLAALIALIGYYIYRRRTRPKAKPAAPPLSPYELVMSALKSLDDAMDVKVYYSTISEAMRRYVEGKFGIPAVDRTTEEIEVSLSQSDRLPKEISKDIYDLLCQADLVKFAKWTPNVNERRGDLQIAMSIVERTSPERQVQQTAEVEAAA